MYNEVIFDLETKKLFSDISGNDPADLGVSIVSVYSRVLEKNLSEVEGNMQSFWEHDFDKMWPIFQEADRIIGFNSLGFDIPALKPHANFPFNKLSSKLIYRVVPNFQHRNSINVYGINRIECPI